MAFVDSAGIPTAGAPDVALLLLAIDYGTMVSLGQLVPATVLGSALGCLIMYFAGSKGGRPLLNRFTPRRRESVETRIDRFGLWAILLAVVGPPPYPTKLFVLSAGVFRMRVGRFLIGVTLGRTIRYGLVGVLAVRFGSMAEEMVVAHYPSFFAFVIILAGMVFAVSRWRDRVAARELAAEEFTGSAV